MNAVVTVGLPIFGLIFCGMAAGRFKVLGPASSDALNRFVYWFALPAMLFIGVQKVPLGELVDPTFVAPYLGGVVVTFALGFASASLAGLPTADGGMRALAASYANVGYMGVPLILLAFGDAGLPSAIFATMTTAAALVAIVTVLVESDLNRGLGFMRRAWRILRALATNPLLLAPTAGALWSITGIALPAALRNFLELMGNAASPCALFALGLFLAGQRLVGVGRPALALVLLKLVVMPGVTWLLAQPAADKELTVAIAILLNSLPTGAGAFVLAAQYGREVGLVSAVTLLSTLLSVATVSVLMAVFGGQG
jgi:hypothetical protein